jgi:hypothetical protein
MVYFKKLKSEDSGDKKWLEQESVIVYFYEEESKRLNYHDLDVWCENNIQGLWFRPLGSSIYNFASDKQLAIFMLTWKT